MTTRSGGARGLVFGGLMAALVVLFALFPYLSMFMVLPMVLTYLRFGGRTALLTGLVAVLFGLMFLGPVPVLTVMVPTGVLPGFAFGYGFKRGLRPILIGALAVAVSFVGFGMTYAVTRVVTFAGEDPFVKVAESEQGQAGIELYVRAMEQTIAKMGETNEHEIAAKQRAIAVKESFQSDPVGLTWSFLPMALLVAGATSSLINYWVCRWVLPRLGHEVPKPSSFADLYVPAWLSVVLVLSSFGEQYLGANMVDLPWWIKLALNIMLPLMYVYIFVGMAVVYGFLRRKDLPKYAAVGYSLIGLLMGGLGLQLYMMIAVFDSMVDIRGLGHGYWRRPEQTP